MKDFLFIFFLFLIFQSNAQDGLVAYFPMDDCGSVVDVTGINNSTFPQGFADGIGCACGAKDTALVLGGYAGPNNFQDQIFLVGNYDNYFDDDNFTVSFYFKSTDFTGNRTILSKMDSCTAQNGFMIRYTPATSFITAFVGENSSRNVDVFGKLNTDRCWHHITLIKRGNKVLLYADGELLDEESTISVMDIRNDAPLILGSGPCVGLTDFTFEGHIDELRVYNRALAANEIEDIEVEIDVLSNRRDTLIVEGSFVDINLGATCADGFSWSPSDPSFGVEDPSDPETRITPPETGTYYLTMTHPAPAGNNSFACTAVDSIHITVVNPDSLDCSEIFLPKAFTPNGDGINDFYGISNPYAIINFVSFEIFDRWGGRVFYSEDPNDQWSGSFNGKKTNPGVCVYRVVYNCQGEEKIKLGSFTVLR